MGTVLFQDSQRRIWPACPSFNPTFFQAEEWVKLAKAAGMKYIVVTSKHHEGFAMFKSDVGKFNIYDATPFKRDVIAEFAEACKKHDMKLGLYYSQALDWHDPNGARICGNNNKRRRYALVK